MGGEILRVAQSAPLANTGENIQGKGNDDNDNEHIHTIPGSMMVPSRRIACGPDVPTMARSRNRPWDTIPAS